MNVYAYDYVATADRDEMYKEPEECTGEIKSTDSGEFKLYDVIEFKQVSLYSTDTIWARYLELWTKE